jgi:hypothetical protein
VTKKLAIVCLVYDKPQFKGELFGEGSVVELPFYEKKKDSA